MSFLANYESTQEIKRLKAEYALNPDSISLAIQYSQKLLEFMEQIYDPEKGNHEELAAYRTLLCPLTEVYQKHGSNEIVAETYLCGISSVPVYQGEDIVYQMAKIVSQFPNNLRLKNYFEAGLFFLVKAHVERKDVLRAERNLGFFETFYLKNSTNEHTAANYATALAGVASIQGYFKGRKTLAKLKELAKKYPYNGQIIAVHKNVQNYLKIGNFLLITVADKNNQESLRRKHRTRSNNENPIFKAMREIFGDGNISLSIPGDDDSAEDDNNDDYSDSYTHDNDYSDDSYNDNDTYSDDYSDDNGYGDD